MSSSAQVLLSSALLQHSFVRIILHIVAFYSLTIDQSFCNLVQPNLVYVCAEESLLIVNVAYFQVGVDRIAA